MPSDFDEKLKTMTEDLTSDEEPCLALKIEAAKETQVFLRLARQVELRMSVVINNNSLEIYLLMTSISHIFP